MKILKNIVLVLSLAFPASSLASLKTVDFVDVGQYLGTWYQIARNPLFFEGNCSCSRQVLAATQDGQVSVYNSCNDGGVNGPLREIRGYATSQDSSSNSKFTVDFNLPHKGDYWIIGLGAEYRYAVVSDPSEKSLYILSKTPELDSALYQEAVQKAAAQMDASQLILTTQQGCSYP